MTKHLAHVFTRREFAKPLDSRERQQGWRERRADTTLRHGAAIKQRRDAVVARLGVVSPLIVADMQDAPLRRAHHGPYRAGRFRNFGMTRHQKLGPARKAVRDQPLCDEGDREIHVGYEHERDSAAAQLRDQLERIRNCNENLRLDGQFQQATVRHDLWIAFPKERETLVDLIESNIFRAVAAMMNPRRALGIFTRDREPSGLDIELVNKTPFNFRKYINWAINQPGQNRIEYIK
ncbi:MAG: hypothetical protein KF735_05825 [Chelatococcus sp.]|uniref:hypothetical protein n=1 Tax=Chelatococcus sp. TaxID=1953771 RepID=UPI0025C4863C|nr:hypothetical protein [Chelatococcus sp.]MBX3537130.1 hypothetical protein [Chelatococcus sp.]